MKTLIQFLALLLVFVAFGCDDQVDPVAVPQSPVRNETDSDAETQLFQEMYEYELYQNQQALESRSDVFATTNGEALPNAFSKMIHTSDKIVSFIHSSHLKPNSTYTIWMMVFKNPQNCSQGVCDENDIFDGSGNLLVNADGTFGTQGVDVSVLWVDGKVSSKEGAANFFFEVHSENAPGEVLFGPGLTDPFGAEIQLVIRDHGPEIPGLLQEQLNSYAGGCNINNCSDIQIAVHRSDPL